jgi:hypothetical protein
MSTLSEIGIDGTEHSSLPIELQLQAWQRLASELQGRLDETEAPDSEATDELEEIESPRVPPKQSGPKMVVLSETDRFKIPKSKGSGGGRKRYHESFLEEQERSNQAANNTDEPTSKKTKSGSDDHSKRKKNQQEGKTGAPPQSRKKRNTK